MEARQLFLAHQDEQRSSWRRESSRSKIRTTTTRYSVYPLPLDRPSAGMTVTVIRCGKCGREMQWKVYSAPLGRRRRRWTRACGWVLLACAIAALPAFITLSARHAPAWIRIAAVTPAVMTGTIFGLGLVLLEGRDNRGVRLRGGGLTHSVRDNDATVVTTQAIEREPPRR
jgi:hypothetical protein